MLPKVWDGVSGLVVIVGASNSESNRPAHIQPPNTGGLRSYTISASWDFRIWQRSATERMMSVGEHEHWLVPSFARGSARKEGLPWTGILD